MLGRSPGGRGLTSRSIGGQTDHQSCDRTDWGWFTVWAPHTQRVCVRKYLRYIFINTPWISPLLLRLVTLQSRAPAEHVPHLHLGAFLPWASSMMEKHQISIQSNKHVIKSWHTVERKWWENQTCLTQLPVFIPPLRQSFVRQFTARLPPFSCSANNYTVRCSDWPNEVWMCGSLTNDSNYRRPWRAIGGAAGGSRDEASTAGLRVNGYQHCSL